MITPEELELLDFEFIKGPDEWHRDSIRIYLEENGTVTYIRQHENYHGLSILIRSAPDLATFLSYVIE
jgi:hypothetical protein